MWGLWIGFVSRAVIFSWGNDFVGCLWMFIFWILLIYEIPQERPVDSQCFAGTWNQFHGLVAAVPLPSLDFQVDGRALTACSSQVVGVVNSLSMSYVSLQWVCHLGRVGMSRGWSCSVARPNLAMPDPDAVSLKVSHFQLYQRLSTVYAPIMTPWSFLVIVNW